ncbi:MAG: sugar ABC transporter permease, partial [Mesorhizobium sp.]
TQYGLVDALLRIFNLPDIPWLTHPAWALVSVIVADVWQNTPLMVLLFLAGLQSLPQEPLEAATVDGAMAALLAYRAAADASGHHDRADAAHHRHVPHLRRRLADDARRTGRRH